MRGVTHAAVVIHRKWVTTKHWIKKDIGIFYE